MSFRYAVLRTLLPSNDLKEQHQVTISIDSDVVSATGYDARMASVSPSDYATNDDLLVDHDEGPLMRRVLAGIAGGMVLLSLISIIFIQVTTGWGWGNAIAIGIFGGFWAGLFFGAAAGNAVHMVKTGSH